MAKLSNDVIIFYMPICENCVEEDIIASLEDQNSNMAESIISLAPKAIVT